MNISLVIFILTAINFAFQVDFVVFMPLGPTLMERFSLSATEFSMLVSVYTFAAGFTSIFFSLISTFFDKKKMLLSALFFLGVCSFLTGFAESFNQLFLVRFLAGVFSGVLNPLIFAIASDIIPESKRGKALGWIMSGFSLASVLGIPFGLFLSDQFGHRFTFLAISIYFLIILVASIFILPKEEKQKQKIAKNVLLKNFRRCLNFSDYLKGYFLIFFVSGAIFIVVPLLSPFAVNNMQVDVTDLKLMYLCGGILTVFTSRVIGVLCDKVGAKKVLYVVSVLSIFPVIIFCQAGITSVITFIILGSLMMAAMSGMMVPSMTISTMIPELGDRTTFNGILNSMRSFGSAIFAFLGGLIVSMDVNKTFIDFYKIGYTYIGIILLVILFNTLIFLRKSKCAV
jgi:MFS transporter, DHA1 family, inner membrane transport protein